MLLRISAPGQVAQGGRVQQGRRVRHRPPARRRARGARHQEQLQEAVQGVCAERVPERGWRRRRRRRRACGHTRRQGTTAGTQLLSG